MSGECVISMVLSLYHKNLKRRTSVIAWLQFSFIWWTSVTAWLQLSFIWQAKENTSSRHEGEPTQKKRGAQSWLLLLYGFSLSPEPAQCKLG